ncbi:MAG: endonuclease Q family protein [Patescibacteria group bacterium]
MQYVTDLHLHSKYSRAVSPQMTLPVMAEVATQKGLDILTVCDFTHPLWFKEIQGQLDEADEGLYRLKKEVSPHQKIRFLFSTEISNIYKQNDKLRRIHNLVFAPSMQVAEKITAALLKHGCNLSADGRPIIGLWSKQLLELILSIDERCLLIPCHVWTPHFGIYGSASGYESLRQAFEELTPHIYGIETGLSSDPDMNWQVKELMTRTILSFSDAHSAPKMGREATIMDLEKLSYDDVRKAIMHFSVDTPNTIAYTVEFYPEEGKYHFSGHRNCKVAQGPEEIRANGNICPVCKRRMTEGVLYRVQELADPSLLTRVTQKINPQGLKWHTDTQQKQPPYVKLIPLNEIIAEAMHSTVASQKVKNMFIRLCHELQSEFYILLKAPIADIAHIAGPQVSAGVKKVREGNIAIVPGYDGEYGKVSIWNEEEEKQLKKKLSPQLSLNW